MFMTQISLFTSEVVPIAQRVTGDGGESAAPEGGGGFADYALVSLHCLRIYLDTSYRMTIDLLKEYVFSPSEFRHCLVGGDQSARYALSAGTW